MSDPTDTAVDPALLKQFAGQQDALASDTQDYVGAAGQEQAASKQTFNQPAPERNTGIMSVAPYLIGLAALSGKGLGIHATTMLGATNGMVQGLIKGSEQRYTDEKKKYDDAYQKWLDKWSQQQRMYQEMRQVYKGRVDADLKAMEMTYKMMGFGEKVDMDQFKKFTQTQQLADRFKNTSEKINHDRAMEDIQREKAARQQAQADKFGGGKVGALLAALTDKGVSLPAGFRSKEQMHATVQGLIDRHPDLTPDQIAEGVKSGQIDMKVAQTEATLLARKEAGVSGALVSLTQKGGFFDQVDVAAKKINFGDAKTMNQIRLAAQGKTVANPDIMAYRNKIEDTRAEYVQVLSRSGVPSESVRKQSEEMFPLDMSYSEWQAARKASIEIAQSVLSGNEKVMEAIKTGKPLSEVLDLTQDTSSGDTFEEGKVYVDKNGNRARRVGKTWQPVQ